MKNTEFIKVLLDYEIHEEKLLNKLEEIGLEGSGEFFGQSPDGIDVVLNLLGVPKDTTADVAAWNDKSFCRDWFVDQVLEYVAGRIGFEDMLKIIEESLVKLKIPKKDLF